MSTPESETRALKRLAALTWKDQGTDDFIEMAGYFTPQGAKDLSSDLGFEAREALGFSLIANQTKAMMRRSQAERLFRLEGLELNVQTAVRAR